MMNKQREIWDQEYGVEKNFESSRSFNPSLELLDLEGYFQGKKIDPAGWIVLDLACGNGRNSLYALDKWRASKTIGVDFSREALGQFRQKIEELGLTQRVEVFEQSLGQKLALPDTSVDLALDIYGSINANKKDRQVCRDEVFRVLKQGGLMLTYLTSFASGFVQKKMDVTLGHEPRSVIFGNGKFEKTFTEEEIRVFYKKFEVVELRKHNFVAGKYPVEMFWVLLRKR